MRKKVFTILFMFVFLGMSYISFAQKTISGTVSSDSEVGIPGVTVLVKGTNIGTISDLNGKYKIEVPEGKQFLVYSYIGMETQEVKIFGSVMNVKLISENEDIAEVLIVASFAEDRKTPVSFSTITPEVITEKLGNQEFPEVLKSTPSIYATKNGGGYGDSRINLRGFDSNNIGVLINGVPINGMENGKVYWSNWAGLSDVTRLMQVQRGLGASKLAISSVGGTINIITKTTDAKKGGSVYVSTGNNGYSKTSFTLSTGLTEKGWAATVSGSRTSGDGYIRGTDFLGYSYFVNVSKRINRNHSLALTAFGAPQWHNQRNSQHLISEYLNHPDRTRYNSNFGFRNGKVYGGDRAYNKYHKPQISLNHNWNINATTSLSTALYASKSTGGGRRIKGERSDYLSFEYPSGKPTDSTKLTPEGYLDFDAVIAVNEASKTGSKAIVAMAVNSHDWYGVLSTLNTKVGDINLTAGIDGRYYKGYHTEKVEDLLGGSYYLDGGNINRDASTPLYKGDNTNFFSVGEILWEGVFAQGEYVMENFSAFVSASVSNSSYRRLDYFKYYDDKTMQEIADIKNIDSRYADSIYLQKWEEYVQTEETVLGVDKLNNAQEEVLYLAHKNEFDIKHTYQNSGWQNFLGYSAKGGVNYNINQNHNVFLNGGYFVRAPYFKYTFQGHSNDFSLKTMPERVLSSEIGYGYRSKKLNGNLSLYRTEWKDKAMTKGNIEKGSDIYTGLDAVHMGVEAEFTYKPSKKLKVKAMLSVGDWTWSDEVLVESYDQDLNLIGTFTANLGGVHVGDAAQTSAALGIDAEVLPKLSLGIDVNYYDNLYSKFYVNDRVGSSSAGIDAWKMPSYTLADFSAKYKFKIANLNASVYGKINNILDTEYIADATDGGDAFNSPVFFGFGRTWSIALKIRF